MNKIEIYRGRNAAYKIKQERTDDYAKYNVKTIIVGYGKTGI